MGGTAALEPIYLGSASKMILLPAEIFGYRTSRVYIASEAFCDHLACFGCLANLGLTGWDKVHSSR